MAEDDGDLRHAHLRQRRLVSEDAPGEMAVGEELGLQRQEAAGTVAEMHDGQAVLDGDVEGPYDLLDRQRIPGTPLHAGVVGVDDHLATRDDADAGDDAGARHVAVIGMAGGESGEFEEGRPGVEQGLDPVADEHLSLSRQAVEVALRPDAPRPLLRVPQVRHQAPVVRDVGEEIVGAGVDGGDDPAHVSGPPPQGSPARRRARNSGLP